MNTFELELGTPAVHMLGLLQFPGPPFQLSVWPKALLRRILAVSKTNSAFINRDFGNRGVVVNMAFVPLLDGWLDACSCGIPLGAKYQASSI